MWQCTNYRHNSYIQNVETTFLYEKCKCKKESNENVEWWMQDASCRRQLTCSMMDQDEKWGYHSKIFELVFIKNSISTLGETTPPLPESECVQKHKGNSILYYLYSPVGIYLVW